MSESYFISHHKAFHVLIRILDDDRSMHTMADFLLIV